MALSFVLFCINLVFLTFRKLASFLNACLVIILLSLFAEKGIAYGKIMSMAITVGTQNCLLWYIVEDR